MLTWRVPRVCVPIRCDLKVRLRIPRVRLFSNVSEEDHTESDIVGNMSGASRKMKNPLLSAAGQGFPYEDYTENALLVPVTPATPAVLRDGELDKKISGWGSAIYRFRVL